MEDARSNELAKTSDIPNAAKSIMDELKRLANEDSVDKVPELETSVSGFLVHFRHESECFPALVLAADGGRQWATLCVFIPTESGEVGLLTKRNCKRLQFPCFDRRAKGDSWHIADSPERAAFVADLQSFRSAQAYGAF